MLIGRIQCQQVTRKARQLLLVGAGEQVHDDPHALLGEVVRVSGVGEQARGEESSADISISMGSALLGGEGVLESLELVVLLVCQRLHAPQQIERNGNSGEAIENHAITG